MLKFWQRRKNWEVDFASKLRQQSGFTVSWKYCLSLCSLRRFKGAGCADVYLRLPVFGKCLKWVFQVCFRKIPVGRDFLEVKRIVKVKFLWNVAATAGRFYDWVSVFLEKHPKDVSRGTLSMVMVDSGFLRLYSLKRWKSVSSYNLHKEHSEIKDFLKKKQILLHWIRHRYQSKTCVEHIEQVIDKSLINSTNSFMNLLSIIFCKLFNKYCKKYMRKSNQETFNFFGRIYGNE